MESGLSTTNPQSILCSIQGHSYIEAQAFIVMLLKPFNLKNDQLVINSDFTRISNMVYRWIARNRSWLFVRRSVCYLSDHDCIV